MRLEKNSSVDFVKRQNDHNSKRLDMKENVENNIIIIVMFSSLYIIIEASLCVYRARVRVCVSVNVIRVSFEHSLFYFLFFH